MLKEYTIGEIFRKGLLKTNEGKPYKDKATVSNVLRRYPHRAINTAFGPAKMYSIETIKKVNKRWN